jgi:hypothetical protein
MHEAAVARSIFPAIFHQLLQITYRRLDCGAPVAALAAVLFQNAHVGHHHAAVGCGADTRRAYS